MANIKDKVSQIRKAVYGKDVRESIASGIEAMNAECEDTNIRQTIVDNHEKIRLVNEQTRCDNEATRVSQETDRINNENNRISLETQRDEAEQDRLNSEVDRRDNEDERIRREEDRLTKEDERLLAEKERIKKETERLSSEITRVNSEESRMSNETERASAEETRIENETIRVDYYEAFKKWYEEHQSDKPIYGLTVIDGKVNVNMPDKTYIVMDQDDKASLQNEIHTVDERINDIIETGVSKLVHFKYKCILKENTDKVEIPYPYFNSSTDLLEVSINGLDESVEYEITNPTDDELGYITLSEVRNAGTVLILKILKNIPSGDEGSIPGNIIAIDSIPENRITGLNYSNPNIIINGDFQVNQKNKTIFNDQGYIIDRWFTSFDTDATFEQTTKGIKITPRVDGSYTNLVTRLEGDAVKKYIKDPMTISCKILSGFCSQVWVGYVKKNETKLKYVVTIVNPDKELVSSSFKIDADPYEIEYIEIGVQAKSSDGNTLEIEYVKLEVGDKSTPNRPRLYSEELNLCKRYYQKLHVGGTYTGLGNVIPCVTNYPVQMRIIPTFNLSPNILIGPMVHQFNKIVASLDETYIYNMTVEPTRSPLQVGGYYMGSVILDAEIYYGR